MNEDPSQPAPRHHPHAWLCAIALALGLAALGASPAQAQDSADDAATEAAATECPAGTGDEVCFRFAGRTHRPRAFYVLSRSLPRRDDPALRRSFVREIAASTRRGPL